MTEKRPVEILTRSEVENLIKGCNPRYPTGARNRALIATLYRGGLRISEALALYPKDINGGGMVNILNGKGGKSRKVGLPPGVIAMIDGWVATREGAGINGDAPLFCTLDGNPLQTAYTRALLPRLAKKAGITKRVHAHALRHAYAFELVEEGHNIVEIQAALGHTSLDTTATYLAHLNPAAVIAMGVSRDFDLD